MTRPSDESRPIDVPSGPVNTPPPAGTDRVPPGPGGVPRLPSDSGGFGAGAFGAPGHGMATATIAVATYADYPSAQRAVDYLSDNKFPVERIAIIGTDLRLVESVLGRLTTGRAALAGAASGAWFGLFIGLLFGIFSNSNWLAVLLVCILVGAIWGAIFGAIAHATTGGRRDFASRSSLQAGQYAVIADAEVADQARQLLTRLNWQTSGAS
jgi:Heat induced stress protein YflT domain